MLRHMTTNSDLSTATPDVDLPSFEEVARRHGVTMAVELVDSNPHMSDGWAQHATHHRAMLSRAVPAPGRVTGTGDRRMVVREFVCHYSTGTPRDVSVGDVLGCLVSDWSMHEDCTGKWDWFDTFGITPSEQAERDYVAGREQSDRFFDFASGGLLRDLTAVAS